ncbi:MAG: hypothetical protein E7465_07735 [Ruminococcaceae bacterium]|nr:hypothetical protein [Oscillospiraceae bacterium]
MIQKMLRTITTKHHLNAITIGEYAKMKVGVMNFQIWAFHAEGLGHVSAMTATGMFGLMKMDTLIINPTERDMPLFSYDRVHALGNDTLIYELYDTILEKASLGRVEAVKENCKHLPDHDLGEHWYDSIKLAVSLSKKGKNAHTPVFDACALEYLEAYLADAAEAEYCEPGPKKDKASVYVEGLLKHGGPSTDVFKKGIGDEKTAELFRNILFGTAR